jgi:hypothetical protein
VLIDGRLTAIVPTLHAIFNVASANPDRAHAWRMDCAQLTCSNQLPD